MVSKLISWFSLLCDQHPNVDAVNDTDEDIFPFSFSVVDFMLTKCMVRDLETNFQCLKLNWASKANAIQRKGRQCLCVFFVNLAPFT